MEKDVASEKLNKLFGDLFEPITEKEKMIACKFPLPEKYLKELCLKRKCIVQCDHYNLLLGIEKKIRQDKPKIKDGKKILAESFKWYKGHQHACQKYLNRQSKYQANENEYYWQETKIHNLLSLGIHPRFCAQSYEKYKNFNVVLDFLNKFEKSYAQSEKSKKKIPAPVSPISNITDISQITVINTQNSNTQKSPRKSKNVSSPNEKTRNFHSTKYRDNFEQQINTNNNVTKIQETNISDTEDLLGISNNSFKEGQAILKRNFSSEESLKENVSDVNFTFSLSETDESIYQDKIITIKYDEINTQDLIEIHENNLLKPAEDDVSTEDLIAGYNKNLTQNIPINFESEEIVASQQLTYENFNNSVMIATSTQNNEIKLENL